MSAPPSSSAQPEVFHGDALAQWLMGGGDRERQRFRVQLALTSVLLVTNVIGALVVASLALFVIPGPSVFHGRAALVSFVGLPVYVVAALVVGAVFGTRRALRTLVWTREDREPTEREAVAAFAVPGQLLRVQALLWGGAVVLFTALYGAAAGENVPRTFFAILAGGSVVCANAYLLSEFALRPVAARALLVHGPDRKAGVRGRTLLAWASGSAIPVAGTMVVAVFAIVRGTISTDRLAAAVLALGLVTLVFGLLLMQIVSRATVGPIRAVRAALAAVGDGDLDVEVSVYDGTELGELQSGFNEMASGLRERERMRDLFGRQVGRSVAAAALASKPELGGEERSVAVVFVDVVGSTTMGVERPPAEVVALLNRFFTVVVEEVEDRGGLINKFIGDAALAIFGAPTELEDPCTAALSAARAVVARMAEEVPDVRVGSGVAAGVAVAGNIGTHDRFEYTVIGDPVNEAARLSDLAKTSGGLVASGRVVGGADDAERGQWRHDRDETLRGRDEPTAVWVPGSGATSRAGR